ncbi:MAG: alpha/beta hydrolase, partial [Lacisediminihabitans sp.]
MLLLSLLLSGCVAVVGDGSSTSTPTGEQVSAAAKPYYSQILHWKNCGNGQQCTTVTTPLDWGHPSSATDISLALTRHRASGTALGSLFVNPGGPGGSGYNLVHDSLDAAVSKKLQKSYDVIGWDPRGVGRSTPVTCYDAAGLDKFLYGVARAPVNSPAWVSEVTQS